MYQFKQDGKRFSFPVLRFYHKYRNMSITIIDVLRKLGMMMIAFGGVKLVYWYFIYYPTKGRE